MHSETQEYRNATAARDTRRRRGIDTDKDAREFGGVYMAALELEKVGGWCYVTSGAMSCQALSAGVRFGGWADYLDMSAAARGARCSIRHRCGFISVESAVIIGAVLVLLWIGSAIGQAVADMRPLCWAMEVTRADGDYTAVACLESLSVDFETGLIEYSADGTAGEVELERDSEVTLWATESN